MDTIRLVNAAKLEEMTANAAIDYICNGKPHFDLNELKDNIHELSCQNDHPSYQFAIYDVLELIEEMIEDID